VGLGETPPPPAEGPWFSPWNRVLLVASALLLLGLAACGTSGSGDGPRPSLSAPSGYVDPPMAETPEQAVTFYLDAVKHGDCRLADQYTTFEFHNNGDLCDGPTPRGLAFDAWRFDPSLPPRRSASGVYMYAVELHITKHGCAGSICSNGWHTRFLQARGKPSNGYLLEAGGTGP